VRSEKQEVRSEKQEYKKLLPKWWKQCNMEHRNCIIYSWPCGNSEKQEYIRRAHSPHFLIPPSPFAFCTSNMSDRITNSKVIPVM